MAKSNDKKSRTRGVIPSSNTEFPDPMTAANTKTANYEYTDKDRIQQHAKENRQL